MKKEPEKKDETNSPVLIPESVLSPRGNGENRTAEIQKTEFRIRELESLLEHDASPEVIKNLLMDLCKAEDTKVDREGNFYTTPNWAAKMGGFDRLVEFLRYKKKEATVVVPQMNKIIIQVVDSNKPEKEA